MQNMTSYACVLYSENTETHIIIYFILFFMIMYQIIHWIHGCDMLQITPSTQEDAPVRHVVSAPARPRQTTRGSQMQKTLEMMRSAQGAGRKTFSLRTARKNSGVKQDVTKESKECKGMQGIEGMQVKQIKTM